VRRAQRSQTVKAPVANATIAPAILKASSIVVVVFAARWDYCLANSFAVGDSCRGGRWANHCQYALRPPWPAVRIHGRIPVSYLSFGEKPAFLSYKKQAFVPLL